MPVTICDRLTGEEIATIDSKPTGILAQYAALEETRRQAAADLEKIEEQLKRLEPAALDAMADQGASSTRIGNLTLYVKTDRYVSKRGGIETAAVNEALKATGLGHLVAEGYNAARLKSIVLERKDGGEELPEALSAVLNVGETLRLAARR